MVNKGLNEAIQKDTPPTRQSNYKYSKLNGSQPRSVLSLYGSHISGHVQNWLTANNWLDQIKELPKVPPSTFNGEIPNHSEDNIWMHIMA